MLKSLGRFHSLVVPLFTWLILLVPFLIYQRYYVSSQQAYLTEHGFRLLAAVGRQLDSYVDSVSKTVEAAQRAGNAASKDDRRRVFESYLTTFLPDLPVSREKQGEATKPLSLEFGPRPAVFRRRFEAPISGRISLDDAIRERLSGIGEDYFDDVLIANSKGEVLFQRSADTRISKLDPLVQAAGNKSSGSPTAAAKTPAESASNPQPPREPPFATLAESSNVLETKLAGEDYKLFLQPFRLSSAGSVAEDSDKLVLCGLWRAERLSSESFALPYSSVIWFGLFCVAAGSFVWPFLKINYMSQTERLRRSHVWLLVLSMFLGAASATLMVLNASFSSAVQSNVDDDLHTLAGQIQKNVALELTMALDQLTSWSMDKDVQERAAKKWDPSLSVLKNSKTGFSYPYFDMAFWADGSGQQLVKSTVDGFSTPQTLVKEYPFFRDVLSQLKDKKPVVPLLATMRPAGPQYRLQPLVSGNTGRFIAVIASPFAGGSDSIIKVQALVTRLLSLVEPVLPPDFGFAVLDRDGTVLFHSNPLRNLSENFIRECKDPQALEAALFSDSEQTLDIVYSGMDRRALVTKIEHLGPEPFTLIVFHNTVIDLTVNMAIILIGSILMGLYTFAMLVVAAIDLLRGAKYPPDVIWPRRDCSLQYVLVFATNGLLVLIFLLLYSHLWELGLLALTVGILVLAILCTAVLMKLRIAVTRWDPILQPRFKIAYVAAAVSLLVAVTVVPCFGFFKFSHDAASELAAKHGQLRVLNELSERLNRISNRYRDLEAPEKYTNQRINETLDRYDEVELKSLSFNSFNLDTDTPDSPLQQEFDDLLARAARWFPSNKLGGQMRMLHFDSSNEDRLKWSELRPNIFRLQSLENKDYPSVDARFAEWPGVSLGGWTWLGLLWLLVGGWFFLLMKNIFLPDNQSPHPFDQVNWESGDAITANFLVLVDPRSGTSNRLTGIPGIEYLDLRVELDQHALDHHEPKTFSQNAVVVLDHFDFKMNNKVHNRTRLQLLERLLYKDRCRVVLVSSMDPIYYLSEGDPGILADNPQAAAESLDAWTRVMSAFQKVNLEDPCKAVFDDLLNRYRNDVKKKRLVQWMKEECRHTSYLRDFGAVLFRRHQHEERFDPQTSLNELVERSASYYSVLWSTLSAREHLALYQLAKDGWANTKNDRAIRQLQRKGFILCEPMLRVMNESFRLFVLTAQDQREIAEWERQGELSSWRSLKIGFIATAVGLTAWLFYAQKDLFQVSIGYILTLGAAITAITNVLGGIKGSAANVTKASDTGISV